MKKITTIGIVGNGKFSKLIQTVLKEHAPNLTVKIFSQDDAIDNKTFFEFSTVAACDIVIPAVPIRAFQEVVQELTKFLRKDAVLIDVCSIKSHPKKVMLDILGKEFQYICTHPMFGPESFRTNGNSVKGLNFMIENITCNKELFKQILEFLQKLELNVIQITSEEHDKKATEFQFATLFTALALKDLGIKRTNFDTLSASRMHDFVERVGDDMGILEDMFAFNEFCAEQFVKIETSFLKVKENITRARANANKKVLK